MNTPSHIIDVSVENFQTDVVEKSEQLPVVLEFYADAAEQSQQLAPLLRRLADEYQGKFLLARIDVQKNQQIVQQLEVRTLPTIKVIFQGQMAQNLEGPQEEAGLRQMLDQLTMSPMERVKEQLEFFVANGQRSDAIQMLQQIIAEEPENHALHAELCDLLVMEGRIDEAKQIMAGLPDDTDGLNKARFRLEFIEAAVGLPSISELTQKLDADSKDMQLRLDLAARLVADDQIEPALEHLLEVVKQDREWDEQIGRKTMIKVFDLLGKGNELATRYRRKMFTFLH